MPPPYCFGYHIEKTNRKCNKCIVGEGQRALPQPECPGFAVILPKIQNLPPIPAPRSGGATVEVQGSGFMEARPTSVEAVEDPSPTERRLSANQVAYINDAQVVSDR